MDYLSPLNHSTEPYTSPAETNPGRSRTLSAAASSRQTLDIAITTAEGDRVTLNSSTSTTAAFAVYAGPAATGWIVSISHAGESSLSVEGTLSKAEARDIAKAVHAYTKVMKDVASGRTRPAEAHARQVTKMEEISSFDAIFTSRQAFAAQDQSIAVFA